MINFNNIKLPHINIDAASFRGPAQDLKAGVANFARNASRMYGAMRQQFDPEKVKASFHAAAASPQFGATMRQGRSVFANLEQRTSALFHKMRTSGLHAGAHFHERIRRPQGHYSSWSNMGAGPSQASQYQAFNGIHYSAEIQKAIDHAAQLFQAMAEKLNKIFEHLESRMNQSWANYSHADYSRPPPGSQEHYGGSRPNAGAQPNAGPRPDTSQPSASSGRFTVGTNMSKEDVRSMIKEMRSADFDSKDLAKLRQTLIAMRGDGDAAKAARETLEKDFAPRMPGIMDCDGVTTRNLILELGKETAS